MLVCSPARQVTPSAKGAAQVHRCLPPPTPDLAQHSTEAAERINRNTDTARCLGQAAHVRLEALVESITLIGNIASALNAPKSRHFLITTSGDIVGPGSASGVGPDGADICQAIAQLSQCSAPRAIVERRLTSDPTMSPEKALRGVWRASEVSGRDSLYHSRPIQGRRHHNMGDLVLQTRGAGKSRAAGALPRVGYV